MKERQLRWTLRLTASAESDFRAIVIWTAEHFGARQARVYAKTISNALAALSNGPKILGVVSRDEIMPGLFSLHVARQRRKGRHFIMFRIGGEADQNILEVARILHDAMDFSQHLGSLA